jgi:hypothetical protein
VSFLPTSWQDFATLLATHCHAFGKLLPCLWQSLPKAWQWVGKMTLWQTTSKHNYQNRIVTSVYIKKHKIACESDINAVS